ncbi:MAG: hypothetical protein V3V62_06145 [bacterium]
MGDRRTKTITLHASGAEGGNGNSTPFGVSRFTEALLLIDVTAVSGASPTLDLDVEAGGADDALGWVHTSTPQITGTGKVLVKLENLGPWLRLAWTIGGGTPSFTFEAKLVLKN